jgi:hypothetical protein
MIVTDFISICYVSQTGVDDWMMEKKLSVGDS